MEASKFVLSKVAVRFSSAVLICSGVEIGRDCIGGGAASAVAPSMRYVINTRTLEIIVAVHYD